MEQATSVTLRPLYHVLANLVQARANSASKGNTEWFDRHSERIDALVKEHLPSGSGFDIGTKIDLDASTSECLVLTFSFHHMDQHGGYDGWTDHSVIVKPSLLHGITMRFTGRDYRKDPKKDYFYDVFVNALREEVAAY